MSRVPFIEQMEHSECGLACLAMILGYYKHYVSLTELREHFDPPRGGISFFHLMKIGNFYNLEGKAFKVGECDANQINAENFPLPFIAHWDEGKHFVVVEKISKTSVFIVDPAFGKRKISKTKFQEMFTGSILSFSPSTFFATRKKSSNVKFFLSFIFEHKKWSFGVLMITLLLQIIGIIVPFLTKWATDSILLPKKEIYFNNLGISVLTIFLGFFLFSNLRGFLIAKLQRYMDYSLMSKFISHLFRLPYTFFENRNSGDLLFRANSHLLISQILSIGLIAFIIDGILIITYAIIMISFSLTLGIIVIILSLLIFFILIFTTPITRDLTNKNVVAQSKVQSFLAENINNVTDIKVMGLEKRLFFQWQEKFTGLLLINEKNNIWSTLLNSITSGIQFIMPLFLLWVGGLFILRGELTLGSLLGFSSIAGMFIAPILSIGTAYTELIHLNSIFQRLFDIFDTKKEDENEIVNVHKIKGKVEFRNVSYRYDRFGEDVLKDIDLTINPGEKIGIVGYSGSGKSTLAKLLLRLYKHTDGEIFIDDRPIEAFNLLSLRKQIGVVLQETRLFHKTIKENIAAQDEKSNMENILLAAKGAEIHDDIMELPLNYNCMLSETGINFSGGQRQRLLLARALYNKPPIIILDEATSSLDTIHEQLIDENISDMNCTRIVIAHRLSTVGNADKIIVLDKGRIVEMGNHHQLIQKKGFYFRLYQTQNKVTV